MRSSPKTNENAATVNTIRLGGLKRYAMAAKIVHEALGYRLNQGKGRSEAKSTCRVKNCSVSHVSRRKSPLKPSRVIPSVKSWRRVATTERRIDTSPRVELECVGFAAGGVLLWKYSS